MDNQRIGGVSVVRIEEEKDVGVFRVQLEIPRVCNLMTKQPDGLLPTA